MPAQQESGGQMKAVVLGEPRTTKKRAGNMSKTVLSHDDRARMFFDRFVTAFATFDSALIADLFATPGVSLRADGSITALTTREDVMRYYQAAIDGYHRNGCRACRWAHLEVTPIGSGSMLAAVTWELLHQDGNVMVTWRQSYCLIDTDDGLKVFASATHVD
jgi:hypothetical protein